MTHPLPVGTLLRTLVGQKADNADGNLVSCPPGSIGVVYDARKVKYANETLVYGIEFPNGVSVFLDEIEMEKECELPPPLKFFVFDEKHSYVLYEMEIGRPSLEALGLLGKTINFLERVFVTNRYKRLVVAEGVTIEREDGDPMDVIWEGRSS